MAVKKKKTVLRKKIKRVVDYVKPKINKVSAKPKIIKPEIVFLVFIQPKGGWGVLSGNRVLKAYDTHAEASNFIKTFYG